MRDGIPSLQLLDVPVATLDVEQALTEVRTLLDAAGPALIAFVNAHSLNLAWRNTTYRQALRQADIVLNDGSGLSIAARLRGQRFPVNLNGTDFTPRVLQVAAECDLAVYLLGGMDGVAADAARALTATMPRLRIVGHHHGFLDSHSTPLVLRRIRDSGAQVLLTGMGNPTQELWLHEHLSATGARVGIAVGAFLDFAAHAVPRAPEWMRAANVEWIYRLSREPRRLLRRYLIGNPIFLFRVLWHRRSDELCSH